MEVIMIINKKDNFEGKNNKRLNSKKPTNCECTAAWQSADENYKVDMVNKPSLDRVIDAKEWVDDGSKL
jgi:hypothetical protein